MYAILFDLDGTLVDTAPALAYALNQVRKEEGLPPLAYERIRSRASDGSAALIYLGFKLSPLSPEYELLRNRLLATYEANIHVNVKLFDGLAGMLDCLDRREIPWGIVTNKPRVLSERLIDEMALSKRTRCLVCPEDVPRKKPYPDPLLLAAEQLNLPSEHICYAGDHLRDIQAAHAAKMLALAISYGYLHEQEQIDQWGADLVFHSGHEIAEWSNNNLSPRPPTK